MTKAQHRALANQFSGTWNREYCYWKLRTDPLYAAVSAAFLDADDGETPLLDIGCGLGLFACYLKESGFRAPVMGIDYDVRKIRAAQARASGSDQNFGEMTFIQGDVRTMLPNFTGHVAILDVLQFLDGPQQDQLVQTSVDALAPGA